MNDANRPQPNQPSADRFSTTVDPHLLPSTARPSAFDSPSRPATEQQQDAAARSRSLEATELGDVEAPTDADGRGGYEDTATRPFTQGEYDQAVTRPFVPPTDARGGGREDAAGVRAAASPFERGAATAAAPHDPVNDATAPFDRNALDDSYAPGYGGPGEQPYQQPYGQPAAASSADAPTAVYTPPVVDEDGAQQLLAPAPTEGLIMAPEARSNRGFSLFTGILATVVFAAAYAALFTAVRLFYAPEGDGFIGEALKFMGTGPFYVPVVVFFLVVVAWSVIANRAGWWTYILASFIVAILAAGAYYLGVSAQDYFNGQGLTGAQLLENLRNPAHLPGALFAFIAARESAVWIAGIAAFRGRRLARQHAAELAEYDRKVTVEREAEAQRTAAFSG